MGPCSVWILFHISLPKPETRALLGAFSFHHHHQCPPSLPLTLTSYTSWVTPGKSLRHLQFIILLTVGARWQDTRPSLLNDDKNANDNKNTIHKNEEAGEMDGRKVTKSPDFTLTEHPVKQLAIAAKTIRRTRRIVHFPLTSPYEAPTTQLAVSLRLSTTRSPGVQRMRQDVLCKRWVIPL